MMREMNSDGGMGEQEASSGSLKKREIALDTETTGLDPQSGHRMVEIGCVELIDRVRSGRHFHAYLNPERDMPEGAFRVHGLSAEFLSDKPLFAEIAESLLEFLGDAPLVIHNAAFDMKFLNAELQRAQREAIAFTRAVDTVQIARRKFPGSPANLDALCKRFNIDLSRRSLHGALLDAELLVDVYLELTGGRQVALWEQMKPSQGAQAGGLAGGLTGEAAAANYAVLLGERHFAPGAEELAAHRAFLAGLKDPLWAKWPEAEEA